MLKDTHLRKFQDFKHALMGRYGEAAYESWFKPLSLVDYDRDSAVINTPSNFAARTLRERFSDGLVDTFEKEFGPVSTIDLRGGGGGDAAIVSLRNRKIAQRADNRLIGGVQLARKLKADGAADEALAEPAKEKAQGDMTKAALKAAAKAEPQQPAMPAPQGTVSIASPLNALLSFERFCVSDCNRMAVTAARSIIAGEGENLVCLHGGPGRGKTHLLNAIGQEWLKDRPGEKVLYLTYDNLLNGYVSAVMSKSVPELRAYLDQIDILLVDDIHLLRGRKATQEELLCLIDRLAAMGRKVVVAGSMAPSSLAETGLNHRLADRLNGGLCIQIDKPDHGLRLRILRQMAEADRLAGRVCVPERHLAMIARRCDASIREIEGAYRTIRLKTETCQSSDLQAQVSDEYVSSVLNEMLRFRTKAVTLDDLLAAVADEFGLTVAEMKSRRRPQSIVKARHAFCILSRKLTDAPLKMIGASLNRDHTTVLSSLDRGEVLAEIDPVFGERISKLMDRFGD